jgi:hypothetical protein
MLMRDAIPTSRHITQLSMLGLAVAMLFSLSGYAQNITTDTLFWEVDEYTDLQTKKNTVYQGTFKTVGTQWVLWMQKNGQRISSYTVQSTSGSWATLADNGSFTYFLQRNGNACTLTLEKNNTDIVALLAYPQQGASPFTIRFHVKSVHLNP